MKNKIICIFMLVHSINTIAVAREYVRGSYPHGSYPHGSYPHGSYPHGSYPHGSYPHGSYPQGKHDDFSGCLIETGVAIECSEGTYKYIGTSSLTKINGAYKKINSKTKEPSGRDGNSGKTLPK